ncbi:integration host factor subunit alpha, partial [Legionella sp. 28fT52]
AETLCDELKLTRPDAKEMVEEFYETLRHALENGQHVKLSGFGNFTLRDKPQRPGRNPKTGEEIPVVARRVVTFKPGLKLKTKIEERGK